MNKPSPHVTRMGPLLTPDPSRVLLRPFFPARAELAWNIVARVLALSERECVAELDWVLLGFADRHEDLKAQLRRRFLVVQEFVDRPIEISPERETLVGAYFSLEYALEAAALFNPSIVEHPDQSGLEAGALRFILSLRATGEGHVSSVTFRTGILDVGNEVTLTPLGPYVTEAQPVADAHWLQPASPPMRSRRADDLGAGEFRWDDVSFAPSGPLDSRVLFPAGPLRSHGIEDARFVRFTELDGKSTYYATFTAYDGKNALPQLLTTDDFLRFRFIPLRGPSIVNKGMALFPRKIDGRYWMLSRQDDENILLMDSHEVDYWHNPKVLLRRNRPWEFVKLGNCGSPIETPKGWLVLSHGVGFMRQYGIGAFLLDLEDPTRVLGRLRDPLLTPQADERRGYVPNVVYTCGAVIHGTDLVIPFAMNDSATVFGKVDLSELFYAME